MLWNSSPSKTKTRGNTKGLILDVECNISEIYNKSMKEVWVQKQIWPRWNQTWLVCVVYLPTMPSGQRRLMSEWVLGKTVRFSAVDERSGRSEAALASSQHMEEMAPNLAKWTPRGEKTGLPKWKHFPMDSKEFLPEDWSKIKELGYRKQQGLFWWHLVQSRISKTAVNQAWSAVFTFT